MSVQVGEMHSEVTVLDGELPLNERQLEKLVQIICQRLQAEKRESERVRESTTISRSATRGARVGE